MFNKINTVSSQVALLARGESTSVPSCSEQKDALKVLSVMNKLQYS